MADTNNLDRDEWRILTQEERKAIRQRDIEEAEEGRHRQPKFHNASPARPAACPSCGHRHKGAMSQSEELRTLWCRKSADY